MIVGATARPSLAAVLSLLLAAALSPAAAAGNPRTTLAPKAAATPPANPSGQEIDPDDQGATTPAEFGDRMRLYNPMTEAEVGAADPGFRHWVDLIRTGRADKPTMRLYSFFRTRLDPFDARVPEGWRDRGLAVLRDGARTRAALLAWSTARAVSGGRPGEAAPAGATAGAGLSPYGRWVPIGPYTIPGRTMGLDRPAGDPNTLYAVVADGGVWRTRDGAQTWEPLTDREATLSGGSILLDPNDPDTIWFGTGEGNGAIDNYGGVGVLKSTDAGMTWTRSNAFSGSVRRLALHRSEPSRLYAAGDSGCYLSTDGGATFTLMSGVGLPTDSPASDVLVRPDDPNTVFCAIWEQSKMDGGIYRSTDHGASFQLLTNGLPAKGSVKRITLTVSKSNPSVMLAGIDQANGTVYKTTDGGNTWTALAGGSVGYCGSQCWYDNVVGIDAADPNVLYLGGVGFYRSLDGGATWSRSDSGVHVDHHFIFTPSPGEVFTTSDGGIFHSTSQAASWSNWGLGMDTTQYYGACRHPSDPDWAAGGTQDNGSHRRSPADTWSVILGGDGGMCMTGPSGSNVVVGEYQSLNVQRSADGGNSFSDANGGIGRTEPHPWVGILEASSGDRNDMWTGTGRVYRSLDARATNWVPVSGSLYFGLSVTAIGTAPSDPNVVYAGYDGGGLFVTGDALDASPAWTSIKGSSFPVRGIRRIRVDPSSADTFYFVFAGYGAPKIMKSTNRGASYTEITGDLPDIPVNDLTIDPASPGTLIAATDLGIYRTDDGGAHWYGWSPGLPTVASIEMTYDAGAGRLRLGTHGRSMWEWRAAAPTPTAVPDGAAVPGGAMKADKLAGGASLRVRWDTLSCTAHDYNLFYGDLANVASYAYDGAVCGLGTSGIADVPMPVSASGNLFFLIASSDGAGSESPHGYAAPGVPTSANGIGFCGIAQQVASASCP